MKSICIYARTPQISGIKITLSHIQKLIGSEMLPIVENIEEALKFDVIVAYAILEAFELYRRAPSKCKLSLMMDATSLIDLSQFKYFRNKKNLSFKERYVELARYYYHRAIEKIIFKKYDKIILQSYYDKDYFVKMNKKYEEKIIVIQNGVDIPSCYKQPRKSDGRIIMGFMCSWGDGTGDVSREVRTFLEYVWKEAVAINPNIYLKLCGRGMSDKQKEFFKKYPNVEGIGEVERLEDYFNQIDINLMIMPKHGGLLNKLLEGAAYKCATLCEQHNVWAFRNIPDCYYIYTDAKSLASEAERIINNPTDVSKKTDLALNYVKEYHEWGHNYRPYVEIFDNLISE